MSNTITCPACGGIVSIQAKTCPHCGQPQQRRCPKCGSTNIQPISGFKKGMSAWAFGVFAANTLKNDYECRKCGHKFS